MCYNEILLIKKKASMTNIVNHPTDNQSGAVVKSALLVAVTLLVGLALGIFLGPKFTNWVKYGQQTNYQSGDAGVMQDLATIMVLPNETPVISTVMDSSNLQAQPFFAKAQQGDKIILYTNYQKAILYRPSSKQIVEIIPTTVNAESFSL